MPVQGILSELLLARLVLTNSHCKYSTCAYNCCQIKSNIYILLNAFSANLIMPLLCYSLCVTSFKKLFDIVSNNGIRLSASGVLSV